MSESHTQWYIRKDGVIHGPASAADLKSLIDAKRITLQQEASQSTEGPWHPLAEYAEFEPVRPISELFADGGAVAAAAPAMVPQPPPTIPQPAGRTAVPVQAPAGAVAVNPGTLTPTARKEFSDGLAVEVRSSVENKAYPASFVIGGIAFFAIARFSMITAFIVGLVVASVAFNVVKSILESKYLRPIADYSDEMLVTRYNEAKAERRAARMRSVIGWAAIAIIFALLFIAWLAARFQMRPQ